MVGLEPTSCSMYCLYGNEFLVISQPVIRKKIVKLMTLYLWFKFIERTILFISYSSYGNQACKSWVIPTALPTELHIWKINKEWLDRTIWSLSYRAWSWWKDIFIEIYSIFNLSEYLIILVFFAEYLSAFLTTIIIPDFLGRYMNTLWVCLCSGYWFLFGTRILFSPYPGQISFNMIFHVTYLFIFF